MRDEAPLHAGTGCPRPGRCSWTASGMRWSTEGVIEPVCEIAVGGEVQAEQMRQVRERPVRPGLVVRPLQEHQCQQGRAALEERVVVVAAAHDDDRPGPQEDVPRGPDVAAPSLGEQQPFRQVVLVTEQHVELHAALGPAVAGPFEQAQTQRDRRGVRRGQVVSETEWFVLPQGQRRAVTDVPKRLLPCQLGEQHCHELGPRGEPLRASLGSVPDDEVLERSGRDRSEKFTEQTDAPDHFDTLWLVLLQTRWRSPRPSGGPCSTDHGAVLDVSDWKPGQTISPRPQRWGETSMEPEGLHRRPLVVSGRQALGVVEMRPEPEKRWAFGELL